MCTSWGRLLELFVLSLPWLKAMAWRGLTGSVSRDEGPSVCVEEEADRECVEAAVCGALRYATADVEGVLVCAVVSSIASGEALRGRSSSEVVVVAAINGFEEMERKEKRDVLGV